MKSLILMFLTLGVWAYSIDLSARDADHQHHDHSTSSDHKHDVPSTEASRAEVGQQDEKYQRFVSGLVGARVAIISVQGMVCDFCARGIEKTFKKTEGVIRVDVDLALGRVLVAYRANQTIEFEDIRTKITNNGQTAVGLEIVSV